MDNIRSYSITFSREPTRYSTIKNGARALGGMALTGLMNPIVNGSIFALLQDKVTPEMQGRVFTLMMSGTAAMAPLGLAVAGPFAEVIGIQAWFVAGGLVIILMSAAAYFVPSIRNLEKESA